MLLFQSAEELSKSALYREQGGVAPSLPSGLGIDSLEGGSRDPLEDVFGPIVSAAPITTAPNLMTSSVDFASTSNGLVAVNQSAATNSMGDLASISLTPTPEPGLFFLHAIESVPLFFPIGTGCSVVVCAKFDLKHFIYCLEEAYPLFCREKEQLRHISALRCYSKADYKSTRSCSTTSSIAIHSGILFELLRT